MANFAVRGTNPVELSSARDQSSLTTPQMKSLLQNDYICLPSVRSEEKVNDPSDPTYGGNYLPPRQGVVSIPRSLRSHMARGRKTDGGLSLTERFKLTYYQKNQGAANTAFSFFFPLQPNLDSNWADYQPLFEAVRVVGATLHWNVAYYNVPTVVPGQTPNAAVAFEPEEGYLPASVNQVLEFPKAQLLNINLPGAFTLESSPITASKGGHMVFSALTPTEIPSQSEVTPLVSTGMWRPTVDASNYFWGGFTGYCAQGGTSSVLAVEGFVVMDVEFRYRH